MLAARSVDRQSAGRRAGISKAVRALWIAVGFLSTASANPLGSNGCARAEASSARPAMLSGSDSQQDYAAASYLASIDGVRAHPLLCFTASS
jgi:hypothetical protein